MSPIATGRRRQPESRQADASLERLKTFKYTTLTVAPLAAAGADANLKSLP
jgi:hypothetical protein